MPRHKRSYCSICNTHYNANDFTELSEHNKKCNSKKRETLLYAKLHKLKEKEKKDNLSLERINYKSKKLKVIQPSPKFQLNDLEGGYTSSITCGLMEKKIKLLDKNHSNDRKLPGSVSNSKKVLGKTFKQWNHLWKKKANTKSTPSTYGKLCKDKEEGWKGMEDTMLSHAKVDSLHNVLDNSQSQKEGIIDDFAELENIHDSGFVFGNPPEVNNSNSGDDMSVNTYVINEDEDSDDGDIFPNVNNVNIAPQEYGNNNNNALIDLDTVEGLRGTTLSRREKKHMELAGILYKANTPDYVYPLVLDWAQTLKQDDLLHRIRLETLILRLASLMNLESLYPLTQKLHLPSGNIVAVTKFAFTTQLHSLLSDPDLMKAENLIYGEDIFRREGPRTQDHKLTDVNSGTWFYDTQQQVCVTNRDVLCPIIIYIDKTFVKSKPCEPVSFTLGIFKREVRNSPRAWRNLGLIPGMISELVPVGRFHNSRIGERRLNDWHFILNYILTDLKAVQRNGPLNWEMFGQSCRLHVPIMYVTGDIQGHDKLCARKGGHGPLMIGVTHSCNIKRTECSNVEHECHYLTTNEVKSLQDQCQNLELNGDVRKEAKKKLDELGFYSSVKNGIADADFGASNYGIHGAVAICLLHTIKQKYPDEVLDFYITTFGASRGTSGVNALNLAIPKLLGQCQRQSDRTLPKTTSFLTTFINPKYTLTANEKLSRTFALLLFCMTTYGWNHTMCPKNQRYKNKDLAKKKIKLIEYTITIYRFLYQKAFPWSNRNSGKSIVMAFMHLFQDVANHCVDHNERNGDDYCTFPKFHYLKHIIDLIIRFGSAMNFDAGESEANHKYITKAPGLRTQARIDVFDEQVSKRFCNKIVLDRALNENKIRQSTFGASKRKDDTTFDGTNDNDDIYIDKNSSKFELLRGNNTIEPKWSISRERKGKAQPIFDEEVLAHVGNHIPGTNVISGFTCLRWKGNIIRAHPSYRKKEWYDWVNIQWYCEQKDDFYICPAQIYMFLELKDIPDDYYTDGIWCVVRSTYMDERRFKPHQDAMNIWKERGKSDLFKYWTMEDTLRLVKISSISSVSFVYKDYSDIDMSERTPFVIEVATMSDWDSVHNLDVQT